ncbi:MAG: hypothetical protein KKD44_27820 [Proteobacteria bacterium]|nr:hypothetical protein [Pseudomonadota bacterium]
MNDDKSLEKLAEEAEERAGDLNFSNHAVLFLTNYPQMIKQAYGAYAEKVGRLPITQSEKQQALLDYVLKCRGGE